MEEAIRERFFALLAFGDVAGVAQMLQTAPELVDARLEGASTLQAVTRCPAALAPPIIDLLVERGAGRPSVFHGIDTYACRMGVEPAVLDCLLKWGSQLHRPATQLVDLVKAATEATPGNVRLVGHVLDLWELEKLDSQLPEDQALDRLEVLHQAFYRQVPHERADPTRDTYMVSVLELPKIREAVELAAMPQSEAKLPKLVAEFQRAANVAIFSVWVEVVHAMAAMAPRLIGESAFVCVAQRWWKNVRMRCGAQGIDAIASGYRSDIQWTMEGPLVLAHCCKRRPQHPLAMIPDLAFNRIREYAQPHYDTIVNELIQRRGVDYCCKDAWLYGFCVGHEWRNFMFGFQSM
ncbi:hypothetical protein BBJ28_00022700 [Nothophytophthora sp. Chile5]|nr:hypothetical protein BBJ28_00022700 [Nothophytophthora sp. Chile5]